VNITSSALERISECAASTVLPQTPFSGGAAKKGTENHEDAEAGKVHPKIAAFLEDVHVLGHEWSFVLDVETRKVRHVGARRSYGNLGPYEVGTTPDVIGVRGDTLVTLDYKSRARVTRSSSNWQIKTHALAAQSFLFGSTTKVLSGIAYLDDGELDMHDFSPIALTAAWVDLKAVCDRVQKVKQLPLEVLQPRAGDHCKYCPALLSCPTQKAMVNVFRSDLGSLTQEDVNERFMAMTDEQIENADDQIHIIEQMLKMAKAGRFNRLEHGPVKLKDGKYLRLIQSSNTRVDWPGLSQTLKAHGYSLENFQTKTHYLKPFRTNK
jgi:hypothetical protein